MAGTNLKWFQTALLRIIKLFNKPLQIIVLVSLVSAWDGFLKGRKEMFYLAIYSTRFILGYIVLDIW